MLKLIFDRLKKLNISLQELAENTFIEVEDILNENLDFLDISFIEDFLWCEHGYFQDEEVRKRDILNIIPSKDYKTNNVKCRVQRIVEDFDFLLTLSEK